MKISDGHHEILEREMATAKASTNEFRGDQKNDFQSQSNKRDKTPVFSPCLFKDFHNSKKLGCFYLKEKNGKPLM